MKDYLEKLPNELKEIISFAFEVSQELKMPAYLVGGFVRDLLLDFKYTDTLSPNFSNLNCCVDLDITVEGSGIIFAQNLSEKLKSELTIHERFGTATLLLSGFFKIDIASARKEKYPSCASLPIVRCGSLQDDLLRRDFTINAMAVCISDIRDHKLIDPFGGRQDLLKGNIRVLHDLSFQDDPTRILRAIRFEQRFNFKIEPKTLYLLKDALKNGYLDKVSPHRIRDELILMLKEHRPLKQTRRLVSLCPLSFIHKKLKATKKTYDLFKSIDKEIAWFNSKFPGYRRLDSWLIYFTALLKDLTVSEIESVSVQFGLRKGEEKRIESFIRFNKSLIESLGRKKVLPVKIFNQLEPLSYETIILLRASSVDKNVKENIGNFFEVYNGMRLFISGKDLADLGIIPGPKYQKIFSRVLEAKLNGQVKSLEQELDLIKQLTKQL
ncbi:MAG: hypothetical protein PHY35_03665 [Candidatus Omnitrophica bacterium]|nr:hypothetical protein [Candidatus Omnitrophota bacterium]